MANVEIIAIELYKIELLRCDNFFQRCTECVFHYVFPVGFDSPNSMKEIFFMRIHHFSNNLLKHWIDKWSFNQFAGDWLADILGLEL